MFEKSRINNAKEKIRELEKLYEQTRNKNYLNQIDEEHKKIRKLQVGDMEKLD